MSMPPHQRPSTCGLLACTPRQRRFVDTKAARQLPVVGGDNVSRRGRPAQAGRDGDVDQRQHSGEVVEEDAEVVVVYHQCPPKPDR
jgi:hypothetical protein